MLLTISIMYALYPSFSRFSTRMLNREHTHSKKLSDIWFYINFPTKVYFIIFYYILYNIKQNVTIISPCNYFTFYKWLRMYSNNKLVSYVLSYLQCHWKYTLTFILQHHFLIRGATCKFNYRWIIIHQYISLEHMSCIFKRVIKPNKLVILILMFSYGKSESRLVHHSTYYPCL